MVVHSKQILASSWIANDVLIGEINGVNKIFELNYTPASEVIIRLNGNILDPGTIKDYIISGKIITFVKAPKTGMKILASYFRT